MSILSKWLAKFAYTAFLTNPTMIAQISINTFKSIIIAAISDHSCREK